LGRIRDVNLYKYAHTALKTIQRYIKFKKILSGCNPKKKKCLRKAKECGS
jgi:hypothetical protein